jgi:hypothetical protein
MKYQAIVDIFAQRLGKLARDIYKQVINETPEYSSNFQVLIGQPFLIRKYDKEAFYLLDSNKFKKSSDLEDNFDEAFSDNCYSLLLSEDSINQKRCQTSLKCLEFYTQPKASGYYLTHQLLFFLIADHVKTDFILIFNLLNA